MAKGPIISPPSTANKMVFRDVDRNPILELEYYNDVPQITPSGIVAQKRSECIEGVDGTLLTMAILLAKPAVALAVCSECRNPGFSWFRREAPSHGILLAANSHICRGCRRRLCDRHAQFCGDSKWRCRRCAFWFRLWSFFTSIFFREERDQP